MNNLWPAPFAERAFSARVDIPGSKSQTNRMLVLAALADSPSTIQGALKSRDTDLMITALNQLGAAITWDGLELHIEPIRIPDRGGETVRIDTGLAGTVMRFVPPVAAVVGGSYAFDGDPEAYVRPMAGLLHALEALGVEVSNTSLPFHLDSPSELFGGDVVLDSSATSQYLSGLLLSAPLFRSGLAITTVGKTPSLPHVTMTVEALRDRGISIDDSVPGRWIVAPGAIRGGQMRVEPDLSNASVFLAAAVATRSLVTIPGWPTSTTQPGAMVPDLLNQMGGCVESFNGELTVGGTGKIRGIDVDLNAAGELAPTFAALGALADSPSRITGVAHLRGHETDRLAALVTEINKLGGDVRELNDGLEINPRSLHGGTWESYHDHRMATAGALIGLRTPGVLVENIETTAKTMPDFAQMWISMVESPSPALLPVGLANE